MATKKKSPNAKKNTVKSSKSAKKSTVSAKAKSKTTKSAATEIKNEPAKQADAKAEVKSVAVRPEVKVSRSGSLSKKDAALKKLNGWNWIFALLYTAQAAALVMYADKAYRGLTSSYLTEDTIAGENYAVYAQAVRHLLDLNLVYLLAALLGVNALMHLLSGTIFRRKYESDLGRRRNSLRWVGVGVGSALMVAATAILVGVSDISLLFLLMASVGLAVVNSSTDNGEEVCGFMGYVKKNMVMQTVGTVAWLAPWIAIGLYMVGSEKYGSGVQAYLYALFATAFFGTTLQMLYLNRKVQKRNNDSEVDYANIDWTYSALGLIVSAAFVWQIFFAIMA